MPDERPLPFGFRRPLGLALSGGGGLGSWQAGVVSRLEDAGLAFDKVWGFSAGALNAAAYFVNAPGVWDAWKNLGNRSMYKLSVRFGPLTLFSSEPVRKRIEPLLDEDRARREGRGALYVVSLCVDDGLPFTASFEPGGRWDGPMIEHLLASSCVPYVYPRVKLDVGGRTRTFIDGGVPGREMLNWDPLRGCQDIIWVSVARPEETGLRWYGPSSYLNARAKSIINWQMSSAARATEAWPSTPRLFGVVPRKPLDFSFLNFNPELCRGAFTQGREDASILLDTPLDLWIGPEGKVRHLSNEGLDLGAVGTATKTRLSRILERGPGRFEVIEEATGRSLGLFASREQALRFERDHFGPRLGST